MICKDNYLRMSFSQILEKKGKRLIGLNKAGSLGGLPPGFIEHNNLENFHNGKYESLMVEFIM